MNWDLILHVLTHSILITGLVTVMMLMIEYFNIQSKGKWFSKIQGGKFRQILLGSFLGLIPGCLGGFAAVSLYTHKLISLGALVAMMICSSGDEAFIILAMIPNNALLLFGLLFVIGIVVGCVVDLVVKKPQENLCKDNFQLHTNCGAKVDFSSTNFTFAPQKECNCGCTHTADDIESPVPPIFKLSSYKQMLKPSKERIILLVGIAMFIGAVIFGILECNHNHNHIHEHSHTASCTHSHCTHSHTEELSLNGVNILNEKWINIVFAIISIVTLLFTAAAKEHFIKEHLWGHVIKKHLLTIFLWTFGTLLICQVGMQYLDVEHWISNNMFIVMLLAIAVGIIPESGPHIVFVTLFAQGVIPFYVLLVNSMVQDGHTTLPLLAESRMSFAKAKLINIIAGLAVGIFCWWLMG